MCRYSQLGCSVGTSGDNVDVFIQKRNVMGYVYQKGYQQEIHWFQGVLPTSTPCALSFFP